MHDTYDHDTRTYRWYSLSHVGPTLLLETVDTQEREGVAVEKDNSQSICQHMEEYEKPKSTTAPCLQ